MTDSDRGVPVAPSLLQSADVVQPPDVSAHLMRRTAVIAGWAIAVGITAAFAAQALQALIGLITNLAFYQRFSLQFVSPAGNTLGPAVIIVPVIGGVIVGLMARYGHPAIRGHGIPETMEQVLQNQSRVSPRITWLKPVSAAIAIGTGGPFGAEGPIIATGGALGSLLGQVLKISADERKVLLAAGAAAGMSATFGAPVSAVLLAIELLLFEYRPRSLIPVALASAAAMSVRLAFHGFAPIFGMADLTPPSGWALALYVLLGAFMGLVAVGISTVLYAIEDWFEHLPIHWMWGPALGAIAVGVAGWIMPATLGVGYGNIEGALTGSVPVAALASLFIFKFLSWVISLGSGSSGGTMAPLFTLGSALGALIGIGVAAIAPRAGVNPAVASLVGMASLFAGATHAVLASVVVAFETTRQPVSLLPLLAGCSGSYLIALLLRPHSLMTEKLARRGRPVRSGYAIDYLEQVPVSDIASEKPVCLKRGQAVEEVRDWMAAQEEGSAHQGFPVLDEQSRLVGVITRKDLLDRNLEFEATVGDLIRRAPVVIFGDNSAREAADQMVRNGVGRLPVVERGNPALVVGIVTRSDLIMVHQDRLHATHRTTRELKPTLRRRAGDA